MKKTLLWGVFSLLLSLWGCVGSSPPASFYQLSPENMDSAIDNGNQQGTRVALERVQMADYLRRSQIVSRLGENELYVDETARWAGSLEEETSRVLGRDLAWRLRGSGVIVEPKGMASRPEYVLRVVVDRFDGALGGEIVLAARWVVVVPGGEKARPYRSGRYLEVAKGQGYGEMVKAQSLLLSKLSADIAKDLKGL